MAKDFDYQQLDDIIHSRIRLAIMSLLVGVEDAEFTFLKEKVNATDGNLSVHLRKLEEAEYVSVKKEFAGRKPVSTYKITKMGINAFEKYIEHLENMLKK
ncbi:MAG: transcriptional regulator [Melioribacteraceae bacterium]|nr:transcriptional regulator [Melioribacteraceae bacterium]MCF8263326.1 transcriptional regulator [Melioribacteraceae bacterium]MCF8431978.1 transcriptional regulator [Melioribacteraceae bacterium]